MRRLVLPALIWTVPAAALGSNTASYRDRIGYFADRAACEQALRLKREQDAREAAAEPEEPGVRREITAIQSDDRGRLAYVMSYSSHFSAPGFQSVGMGTVRRISCRGRVMIEEVQSGSAYN